MFIKNDSNQISRREKLKVLEYVIKKDIDQLDMHTQELEKK